LFYSREKDMHRYWQGAGIRQEELQEV